MASLWPAGVRSKSDMWLFCEMMVGAEAMKSCLDYQVRMPSPRPDCLLYFIPGGCSDDTPLYGLRACVPELMSELKQLAVDKGNYQTPELAVRTGAINGDSWYDHGQLSRSRCTCRINFGGEGKSKTSTRTQPVDCQSLSSGRKYEEVLLSAMRRNRRTDQAQAPVYFDKAFHSLLNDTDHRKLHRIGYHSDKFAGSYVPEDPITSFSWGCTGVLVLRPAPKTQGQTHLIVTRHGDVSIMGGEFQLHFEHAVPPVSEWSALLAAHSHELQAWEIEAMEVEIAAMSDEGSGPRKRQNTTVRWHNSHSKCHWSQNPVNISSSPLSSVAVSIAQFSAGSLANPPSAFKLGTDFRSFGQGVASLGSTVPLTATVTGSMSSRAAVPQTATVTGSSGATACGNTRATEDMLARAIRMVDTGVQTEEVLPPCKSSDLLLEAANFVSAAYSAVEFLPGSLLTCSFTGSEHEWHTEKP